jgi:hypothetical protein
MQYHLAAAALIFFSACLQTPESPPIANGKRALPFDYEAVQELTIVKSDPTTGDSWTAQLKNVGPTKLDWEILAGPHSLGDRKANTPYVRHLLDTLTTLAISEEAAKGPPESYGLDKPRFAMRWDSGEIRIGNTTGHAESFATLPTVSPGRTYKVRGAALQMLDHLVNFEFLRLQTFSTLASDEILEIEMKSGSKSFYAQRGGDDWTDRKNKKLKSTSTRGPQFLVEQIAHARILRFVDDEEEAVKVRKALEQSKAVTAFIGDHQNKKVVMKLSRIDKQVFATSSARGNAVFELFPKTLEVMLSFL